MLTPPPKVNRDTRGQAVVDDDDPDDWDKRIISTGCAAENVNMNECFYDKRDWRLCKTELEKFKQCWMKHQNDVRTETKDSLS